MKVRLPPAAPSTVPWPELRWRQSYAATPLGSADSSLRLLFGSCCLASQAHLLSHVGSPLVAQMQMQGIPACQVTAAKRPGVPLG